MAEHGVQPPSLATPGTLASHHQQVSGPAQCSEGQLAEPAGGEGHAGGGGLSPVSREGFRKAGWSPAPSAGCKKSRQRASAWGFPPCSQLWGGAGGGRGSPAPTLKFLKHLLGLVAGAGPLTIQKYLSHGSACGCQRLCPSLATPTLPHTHTDATPCPRRGSCRCALLADVASPCSLPPAPFPRWHCLACVCAPNCHSRGPSLALGGCFPGVGVCVSARGMSVCLPPSVSS